MTDEGPSFADRVKIGCVGFLGAGLLSLINRTIRWRTMYAEPGLARWTQGPPIVLVFWHGHQLLMPWIYRSLLDSESRPIYVLISQHTDGRMIARAMEYIGVRSVAGSSTRGGRAAVGALVECLRSGCHIAITPDGPKGPRYRSKTGAVRIAQRSGAMIVPAAIGAERQWRFGSWDKMFLPKPFSRAVRIMGKPLRIPSDLDEAGVIEWTAKLDAALNEVQEQAAQFSYGAV
jgi:hypothetical protein